MGKTNTDKLNDVIRLYHHEKLSMREIADIYGTSLNAITYFMRKNSIKRRNFSEINKLRFRRKEPTFKKINTVSSYLKELKAIGVMLYWSEGYKSHKSNYIDFVNSDPKMITTFLNFLRKIYRINEKKLRILLYCHSNQSQDKLINIWSILTRIPQSQFTKPYVRNEYTVGNCRKMKYGLIHIRYFDKKLLLEIKREINYYKNKYARIREVDKPSGL